jgi:hypothetical protein
MTEAERSLLLLVAAACRDQLYMANIKENEYYGCQITTNKINALDDLIDTVQSETKNETNKS